MYNVENATVHWAMKGMADEDVGQWVAKQGKGDNYSITLILRALVFCMSAHVSEMGGDYNFEKRCNEFKNNPLHL